MALDHVGDLTLECSQQRRRRAKNGVRRCMKMNGKLEERSGPTRSVCHVPTTRFRLSGRRRCARPCGTYPTGDLLRIRMANCIRSENSHGNCSRTTNSWPSTTRSRLLGAPRKGPPRGGIWASSGSLASLNDFISSPGLEFIRV